MSWVGWPAIYPKRVDSGRLAQPISLGAGMCSLSKSSDLPAGPCFPRKPIPQVIDTQTAAWQPSLEHAALSDVGLRRSNNEDSMAVAVASSRAAFEQRGICSWSPTAWAPTPLAN